MSRVTKSVLHFRCSLACKALSLEPEELWLQRSATGWHCYRQDGAGARALAECKTPSQMLAFLDGVIVGADPR